VTTDAAGKVTSWADQSGNGNNATLAAGTPTVSVNALTGKPTVKFPSGGTTYFTFPRVADIRTVFWIVKEDIITANPHFLLGDYDTYHFHRGDNGCIWASYSSEYIRNGTTRLMGRVVNGQTTELGTGWRLVSVVTTAAVQANQLCRDRHTSSGSMAYRSWIGDIAEIIIYNRALSSAEVEQVETYLNNKWLKEAIPHDSAISIASGATLDLNSSLVECSALNGSGVVTNSGTGESGLQVNSDDDSNFSGSLADGAQPLSLYKSGNGTLSLSGSTAYSGDTEISGGRLEFNGVSPLTESISVDDAALQLSNGTLQVSSIAAAGSSTFDWASGTISNPDASTDLDIGAFAPITLGSDSCVLDISGGRTGTVAAAVSGSGGLVKAGGGSLFINGAADFSGDLAVSNGVMKILDATLGSSNISVENGTLAMLGSASSATVTVSGNSVIGVTDEGDAGTLTVKDLNLSSGATLNCTADGNADFIVTGTLTSALTNEIVLLNSLIPSPGTYPLIDYTGTIAGGNFAAFHADLPSSDRITMSLVDNTTDKRIDLLAEAVGGNTNLTWSGTVDGNWDIGSTANWKDNTNAVTFLNGDTVLFDDSAATFTVAVQQDVAPAAVTIDNTSYDYSFSGSTVTFSGDFTKQGTGRLTLENSFSYTGQTVIAAGTLQVGNGSTNGIIGSGSITNDGVLIFNHSDALTRSTIISGTGSVENAGSGTLTITADNSYNGGTTLNGPLQIGANGTSGNLGTGPVIINNKQLTIDHSNTLTMPNELSGSGTIYKSNGNTLIYAGNSAYSGAIKLAGGTFTVAPGATVTNLGSMYQNQNVSTTWNINGNTSVGTFSAITTTGGTGHENWLTTLNIAGGVTFNAATINGARVGRNRATSRFIMNINAGATGTVTTIQGFSPPAGYSLENNVYNTLNIHGNLTAGTISGPGGYAQGSSGVAKRIINIYSGGRLSASNINIDDSINTRALTAVITVNDGGVLANIPGSDLSIQTLQFQLIGNPAIEASAGKTITINGVVSGGGNLIKTGEGTLVLASTNNTYTGETIVSNGVLAVSGTWSAGSNSVLRISTGGKVSPTLASGVIVREIYLNDLQYQSGTWGSTASSAQFQNDRFFEGDGVITVLEGGFPGMMFYIH